MAVDNTEYMRISGGFLEVRKKLTVGKPSKSEKNLLVISTGGFTAIGDSGVRVNLTAIKKA